MIRPLRIILIILVALSPGRLLAAIVAYSFTGTVSLTGTTPPYGLSIPVGTPISGQFEYDTLTPASSTSFSSLGNKATYPQSFPVGFTADFGSVPIFAKDYAVHTADNLYQQSDGSYRDVVTVIWASNDNPMPATPLSAGGVNESTGVFKLSLFYDSSTFADISLPANLPTTGFSGSLAGILSHVPTGSVDVLFNVDSLTALAPLRGDLNLDFRLDAADVQRMLQALADPSAAAAALHLSLGEFNTMADVNQDGVFSNADVQSLLDGIAGTALLVLSTATAVPEPSGVALGALGLITAIAARRRLGRRK